MRTVCQKTNEKTVTSCRRRVLYIIIYDVAITVEVYIVIIIITS